MVSGKVETTNTGQLDEIVDRIGMLSAVVHAAEAELFTELRALEQLGALPSGFRSVAGVLSFHGGFTRTEASQRCTHLDTEPPEPLQQLFDTGQISRGLFHSAVTVATPDNTSTLAELAAGLTPAQFEQTLRDLRFAQGLGRRRPGPDDTWFRMSTDTTGHTCINARLDTEDGQQLEAALNAARAAITKPDHPAPVDDLDALRGVARAVTDVHNADGLTDRHGDRFDITVTIDLDEFLNNPIWADHAFHGRITPVVCRDGNPLWVGRTRRTANRQQRRALTARDNGCAFPGCHHRRYLDAHHITPWAQGGTTNLNNLITLCTTHHRQLHDGHYSIRTNGEHFEFVEPDGRTIQRTNRPKPAKPHTTPTRPPNTSRWAYTPLTNYGRSVILHHLLAA